MNPGTSSILAVTALLLASTPALQAATADTEALRAAHQQVIDQPADLDHLYAYARTAIEQGNFEAAIGALEGMLVISRNQPRVLLELGTLYQRLGAPRVAAAYLEQARQLSGEDSRIAAFAQEYLYQAEQQVSPNSWSGFVQFGLRYQSNPALGPEVSEILSGGFRVPLPDEREVESDVNAMLLSRVEHRYQIGARTRIDSDAIFYGTLYNDYSRLNLGALQLSSGVRYSSPLNAGGQYSVRPHIVLRGSMRDGDVFEKTAGAGIDADLDWGDSTRFKATYQYRDINYDDVNSRGTASLRSGGEHRIDLRAVREIARGHVLMLRLFGRTRDAEVGFYDADQFDATLRYSTWFDNFLFSEQRKMSLSPYILRRLTDYGDADPGIDPDTTREDREWRVGLDWSVPFASGWAGVMNLEYSKVDSNIVNYDTTNKLVMFGLRKRF